MFLAVVHRGINVTFGWQTNEGVANGKCETARLAFFFASPRHFDFLDCETETSKCFECERETFRLLKFEPQIWFRAMRRYDNELELACTKVLRRRLLFCQQSINSIIFLAPVPEKPIKLSPD